MLKRNRDTLSHIHVHIPVVWNLNGTCTRAFTASCAFFFNDISWFSKNLDSKIAYISIQAHDLRIGENLDVGVMINFHHFGAQHTSRTV